MFIEKSSKHLHYQVICPVSYMLITSFSSKLIYSQEQIINQQLSTIRPDVKEVRIKHTVFGVPAEERKLKQSLMLSIICFEFLSMEILPLFKRLKRQFTAYIQAFLDQQQKALVGGKTLNKVFGYGSFELEYYIYVRGNTIPYTGTYYLDISKSNEIGQPVMIA